ncbi:MAG: FUSC family protein [Desulfovibrionaceae bacterium]
MNILPPKFYKMNLHRSLTRLHHTFYKVRHKENSIYALKVGLAVVLAHICALLFGLGANPWAPISAIIVMQVHVAASLEMCLFRVVGTMIGAFLGYCAVKVLPGGAMGQAAALMISSSLCAFVMRWDARFRLAGITAVVVIAGSTLTTQIAFFAMDRFFEIIIGVLSALVVSVYIWPVSGAGLLFLKLKGQYCLAADLLEKISAAFLNKQTHLLPNILEKFHRCVDGNRAEFSKLREYEGLSLYQRYPQMDILIASLEQIRTYMTSLLDSLDSDVEEGTKLPIAYELASLTAVTVAGMHWVVTEEQFYQQDMPDVRKELQSCSARFAYLRVGGAFRNYPHAVVIQLFAFYNALTHLSETVALLQERIELQHSMPKKVS